MNHDTAPAENGLHRIDVRQSTEPSSLPVRPRRMPGVFLRPSTRLLIAAVVLVLIVADILIFRNVLPPTQHPTGAGGTPTSSATIISTTAPTPTEGLAPNSPWQRLWTLPALPPPPPAAYGADPPYMPQIAWSPANAQRLYLCRDTTNYQDMPAVLHDLYRSNDQGLHWTAYPLPEATGNCRLEVDPTNADALVLLDGSYHSYVSRDGGQHWQQAPDPPRWNTNLAVPVIQIMAGRLYVEGYWTADLKHWIRWYPVAGEQQHVYVQINPQRPQTLYSAVDLKEFRCAGTPPTLKLNLPGDPLVRQATLCRSDDGGQSWRFIAVVMVNNYSYEPSFCLALNHPATLYAVGYNKQEAAAEATKGFGEALRSTDEGTSWTRLPAVFTGGNITNLPCGADAYAGQSSLKVDWDDPLEEDNLWRNFGTTANGAFYHVLDMAGIRQSVTMTAGVSLLTDAAWKVIAPYPEGLTTPTTNYRLRMLLITPLSGSPVLLGFTDQNVYRYKGGSV
ncbi:MAG TPA: hypothetical protein VH599_16640 [Ktedonobacterales bacterium]|jgi:hypothetical protein